MSRRRQRRCWRCNRGRESVEVEVEMEENWRSRDLEEVKKCRSREGGEVEKLKKVEPLHKEEISPSHVTSCSTAEEARNLRSSTVAFGNEIGAGNQGKTCCRGGALREICVSAAWKPHSSWLRPPDILRVMSSNICSHHR